MWKGILRDMRKKNSMRGVKTEDILEEIRSYLTSDERLECYSTHYCLYNIDDEKEFGVDDMEFKRLKNILNFLRKKRKYLKLVGELNA